MIDIRLQLRNQIAKAIEAAGFSLPDGVVISVTKPPFFHQGDFTTNIALVLAKGAGKKPSDVAAEIIAHIQSSDFIEKTEVSPQGFINFWIKQALLQAQLSHVINDPAYFINQTMAGKTVMVEYTDPNVFKLFHIGHLMSNAIGESLARLYGAVGARVIRANYQGDVGLHVAKAVWGMQQQFAVDPTQKEALVKASLEARVTFLGKAYAAGAAAYEKDSQVKSEIDLLNKKIFERSELGINELYDMGREWSLGYFETIYTLLGTKFDHYFFESEVAGEGKQMVLNHPEIFVESDGARVFKAEEYGLHTRVFINSLGLPTYEAKELGLNTKKFEVYKPDLSIVITGNEINEYFKVLLKAMELLVPNVAAHTRHVSHGMLRLPTGKMSSRTGDVITAQSLISDVVEKIKQARQEAAKEGVDVLTDDQLTPIAIGAIKYSILKQNPGQDIIFDFEKSLSIHGDSGVYLQYAHARCAAIVRKAEQAGIAPVIQAGIEQVSDVERHVLEYGHVVSVAAAQLDPHVVALYLLELAQLFNTYYANNQVVDEENKLLSEHRLGVVVAVKNVLAHGLGLLGIAAPERM